jgi:hypothetical protein
MTDDSKTIEHPSFGYIRASRVSGHATLFDSAIRHHHYVEVTIGTATQELHRGETHVHGRDELLQVAMSEAQFATFITSMNVGWGAPCTLTRMDGKSVPPPPADINTRQTFENHVKEKADGIATSMTDALETLGEIETGKRKLNKGEVIQAKQQVETALRELVSNMPYLLHTFAEQMETLTERAKADINAYAIMAGQRLENGATAQLTSDSEP